MPVNSRVRVRDLRVKRIRSGRLSVSGPLSAALEPGRRPIDELDRALRLDRRHCGVHVLRHHVATVHHAAPTLIISDMFKSIGGESFQLSVCLSQQFWETHEII